MGFTYVSRSRHKAISTAAELFSRLLCGIVGGRLKAGRLRSFVMQWLRCSSDSSIGQSDALIIPGAAEASAVAAGTAVVAEAALMLLLCLIWLQSNWTSCRFSIIRGHSERAFSIHIMAEHIK